MLRRFHIEAISKNHVENSLIFHRFLKSNRREVIHLESMLPFPRGFAFHNRRNIDGLSTWNFDVESMPNRPSRAHWVMPMCVIPQHLFCIN